MKTILALAVVLGVTGGLLRQHPDPYPMGWFCTPKGTVKAGKQTTDHPCACKRMDSDPQCEGTPAEDPVCQQFCHRQHCGCPVICGVKISVTRIIL